VNQNVNKLNTLPQLICITLNVRGIRDATKRPRNLEWAKRQRVDILMLQETHITHDIVESVNRDWNGQCFHSYGETNARGVSIYLLTTRQMLR
jgi:exonuclease III